MHKTDYFAFLPKESWGEKQYSNELFEDFEQTDEPISFNLLHDPNLDKSQLDSFDDQNLFSQNNFLDMNAISQYCLDSSSSLNASLIAPSNSNSNVNSSNTNNTNLNPNSNPNINTNEPPNITENSGISTNGNGYGNGNKIENVTMKIEENFYINNNGNLKFTPTQNGTKSKTQSKSQSTKQTNSISNQNQSVKTAPLRKLMAKPTNPNITAYPNSNYGFGFNNMYSKFDFEFNQNPGLMSNNFENFPQAPINTSSHNSIPVQEKPMITTFSIVPENKQYIQKTMEKPKAQSKSNFNLNSQPQFKQSNHPPNSNDTQSFHMDSSPTSSPNTTPSPNSTSSPHSNSSPHPNSSPHSTSSPQSTSSLDSNTPSKNSSQSPQKPRHPQLEKKGRKHMNDYLVDLKDLIPSIQSIQKPSKGTILMKTVDFVSKSQQRSNEMNKQLMEVNTKISQQQNSINVLLKTFRDHSLAIPSPQAPPYSYDSRSTTYFVQEAGRTMILMTALLFFWFAPWSLPTIKQDENISSTTSSSFFSLDFLNSMDSNNHEFSGRNVLSIPNLFMQSEGWIPFLFWLLVRWVVMTTLLTIAMYSDTIYFSPTLKKTPSLVQQLNQQAKNCVDNGDYQKANELTLEALSLLNRPIPTSRFAVFFGIFYQASRQIAHRLIIGLFVDKYMVKRSGQMDYANDLKEAYLNLSQQVHIISGYSKWVHLYVILCTINLVELAEGNEEERGEEFIIAYTSLAYHVLVHSKIFDFFATIYMYLANNVVNQKPLQKSKHGSFYLIVAYRYLLQGNFQKVFQNLQIGMDSHKHFGLSHQYKECMVVKGWIHYIIGESSEALKIFNVLHEDLSDNENQEPDMDAKSWGFIGLIATYLSLGEQENAVSWLEKYTIFLKEFKPTNEHQKAFMFGLKSILYLREGLDDLAFETANQGLDYLKKTKRGSLPHNVLPLQQILEIHLTLLEKTIRLQNQEDFVKRLLSLCEEELEFVKSSTNLFYLMRPIYDLYYGRFVLLATGNTSEARELYAKSIELSRECKLKYFTGLALFENARTLDVDSSQRTEQLEEALSIFCEFENLYEEQLTRREMKKTDDSQFIDRIFKTKYHDLE